MSKAELAAYYHHLDNVVVLRDNFITARGEGKLEGLAEGRAEGLAEGRAEGLEEGGRNKQLGIALNLKRMGLQAEAIAAATGLNPEEITNL